MRDTYEYDYEDGEGADAVPNRPQINWAALPPQESIFDTATTLDYHPWACGATCQVCADRGPNDHDWR